MTAFGIPRQHVAQCGSTNDLAREWASRLDDAAPSGALVTAEFQTHGRGQWGRHWQAGWGQSALMSFIYTLPPAIEPAQLGLVTAVAAVNAIKSLADLSPSLKWPNDILLNGRKAAGILVEITSTEFEAERKAILGIGINVNQERFVGIEDFVYSPTSLRLATGTSHEIERVVTAMALALTQWETDWRRDGFAPILEECRKHLAVGAAIRQGDASGELVSLSDSGAAHVRLPDGTFADWSTVD